MTARIAADAEVRAHLAPDCGQTVVVTPEQVPTSQLEAVTAWRPSAVLRDGFIAVVGGLVLCGLGLWFLRQALMVEFDDTPRDEFMFKAQFYGLFGLLSLALGSLGIGIRGQRPETARLLTGFGRLVVLGTALLYLLWTLVWVMLE